ncbi:Cdc6-related protein, AAA superfamily ATPase [Cenarchaeum symbiosum A]|uniref:ORC1-type DNA replication protein n=1 Tax=Cenarchaeum symbiosum (strain A) TaxID=414004 RepID=CDC6_CENSY|nr:RecName: Full=ORC1-type DNA replication protein [Cenarchaeum symbiosum A]ABK78449.1 Cdc6-related protein, AAA superfamily ATPase [Cenarchaeum symbiosum A]
MSITLQKQETDQDPVDAILDTAENGKSVIRNREMLRFTYIPETIHHRDGEQRNVTHSLSPILKRSRPSNLLVYGKPGTGKTLVVKKILQKIQERVKRSDFPIKLVYTNAKDETTLYGLLVSFGRQLGLDEKELPPTGLAISEVFKRLIKAIDTGRTNAVFVIDEIDYLAHLVSKTRKDVLYQLTRANERIREGSLTIVGISNDLAFKERLDPRVLSALSEEEVVFANYSVDQIRMILEDRAGEAFVPGAVSSSALNLCAAMAGREHGDARRAIDLLRVAGEMAERAAADGVTEGHVRDAALKIEENKENTALRSYPLHEKLVILAVMRSKGSSTGEIYSTYRELCRLTGQAVLTQRRATQMLSDVELSGMVSGRITHQGIHGRTKKFKLTVPPATVREAFGDDLILADII